MEFIDLLSFVPQLKDGLGIRTVKARTSRLLSEMSDMLTISYHRIFVFNLNYYIILVNTCQDQSINNCTRGERPIFLPIRDRIHLYYEKQYIYQGQVLRGVEYVEITCL